SVIEDLESLVHHSASVVSIGTLFRSHKRLPVSVLRELGVPETMIANLDALRQRTREFLRCAVFYGSADVAFATALCEELRQLGILCWLCKADSFGVPRIAYDRVMVLFSAEAIRSLAFVRQVESWFLGDFDPMAKALIPVQLDDGILHWEH